MTPYNRNQLCVYVWVTQRKRWRDGFSHLWNMAYTIPVRSGVAQHSGSQCMLWVEMVSVGPWVQKLFNNNSTWLLLSISLVFSITCVDICPGGEKAVGGAIDVPWHHHASDTQEYQVLYSSQKVPLLLKNALEESVKNIIKLIKYWPLNTCLFNILCHKMMSLHKSTSVLCNIVLVPRKSTCVIVWVARWTSIFFHRMPFLLERTIGRQIMVIQAYIWL